MSVKRFDPFEQNIKDALNQVQTPVDEGVWEGVKAELSSTGGSSKWGWKLAGIAGVSSAIIVSLSVFFSDKDAPVKEQTPAAISRQEEKLNPVETEMGQENASFASETAASAITESEGITGKKKAKSISEAAASKPTTNAIAEKAVAEESASTNPGDKVENASLAVLAQEPSSPVGSSMFAISETLVCQGKALECRTLNGKSAVWDMGDGNRLEGYRIMYHYLRAGEFKVQAYQRDENDVLSPIGEAVSISVHSKPESGFEVYEAHEMGKPETEFRAHVETGSHFWRLGNGKTAQGELASHKYRNKGYYQVKHIVHSSEGCADSSVKHVRISTAYNLDAQTVFNPSSSTWMPEGLKAEGSKFELRVIDLNGGIAFTSTNSSTEWNGSNPTGKVAREGDIFFWLAVIHDASGETVEYGGNILIISR